LRVYACLKEKKGKNMKFIHISDVHLGKTPDPDFAWSKDRAKEIEETFDKILADCKEKDVDLLLIAGDLFDAPPTEQDLEWVDNKLLELDNTRVILLAGSHDYIEEGSDAETFEFASKTVYLPRERMTNAYLKGINVCVTGFSYGKEYYSERVLEEIGPGRSDAFNILLAYGGDDNKMPFRKEVLAKKGFDYVALGGRHKPAHILKNKMAFCGSPEPLSAKESGKHGYILGEITEAGTKLTWCPVAKRSYIEFQFNLTPEITEEEIVKMTEEKILSLGHQNIYSVVFRGFAKENLHPDFSRLQSKFCICSIENRTLVRSDFEKLEQENEGNIIGNYIQAINGSYKENEKVREKALKYGLEALITAGE